MEIIITIATIAIALCAIASFVLAWIINQRDDEFRQQLSDLYYAMVLSNLLSSDSGLEKRFILFKQNYQGKTPISLTFKRRKL